MPTSTFLSAEWRKLAIANYVVDKMFCRNIYRLKQNWMPGTATVMRA